MTLDEAIEHAKWCANESTGECSKEHRQLTEWLEELKLLRVKCATLTRDNIRLLSDNGMLLTHLEESGVCIDD